MINTEMSSNAFTGLIGLTVLSNVFEWWGVKSFKAKIYSLGPVVVKIQEPWSGELIASEDVQETPSCVYKVVQNGRLLFRYKEPKRGFRMRTPLVLKGSIATLGGQATIVGRAPLAGCAFLLLWLMAWSVGGLSLFFFTTDMEWKISAFILAGWLGWSTIVYVSYNFEKKRFLKVLDEVRVLK